MIVVNIKKEPEFGYIAGENEFLKNIAEQISNFYRGQETAVVLEHCETILTNKSVLKQEHSSQVKPVKRINNAAELENWFRDIVESSEPTDIALLERLKNIAGNDKKE